MIDPNNTNTIRVGELPIEPFNGTDNIPHEVGTELKRGTVQQLADFIATIIEVSGGVGFRAVTVTDGQTLPTTTQQEFILVGKGTYFNVNGGDTLVLTEELNAIVSNGSFWFVGVEIPIDVELAGITQFIREGFTDTAPSENAVFNALSNIDLSSKEDVANKSSSFTVSSTTTYPNSKALVDGLATKENTITAGTTAQYFRGDKTFQTLDKTAVGLSNVDNTSDLNKPISTATQTALNAKQNTISGTANVIPKFGTGGVVGSNITDNGTLVSTSTDMTVNGVRVGRGGGNLASNLAFGNLALNINATGTDNTAIGVSALQNNTASSNTAIGGGALLSNTTGSGNTAIGISSLLSNTTSPSNTAIGNTALQNNTGSSNTAIGTASLRANSTGAFNTAIGVSSGRFISDGVTNNSVTNNSIFIGANSKALGNNQTNQIVIADNGTGLGSNTTVIGNTSTTFGRWFGRFLVGKSIDNEVDVAQFEGTVSAFPATLSNQVVVKSQLDLKADLASPTFTGVPTAPTATTGTNTTQIATTAFVANADSGNVKLTGAQTITGAKTFTGGNAFLTPNLSTRAIFVNANVAGSTGLQASAIGGGGTAVSLTSNAVGGGISNSTLLSIDNVAVNNDMTPLRIKKQGVDVMIINDLGAIISNTLAGTGTRLVSATSTGQLTINNSALLYTNQTITANKTVTIAEFVNNNELILSVNATSGNITITLPTFTALQGYKVTVKKMDSSANSVLIQGVGGINIDGSSSVIISGQYSSSTIGANLQQYIIL